MDCKKCMESAPYPFCCGFECMEHTFCVGCTYEHKFEIKCTKESEVSDANSN